MASSVHRHSLGLLGVAPTTLSKDIHRLREELLAKKLELRREQQLQNEWQEADASSSSSSSKPTVSLADFLPDAGGESWRDEPAAHVMPMPQLNGREAHVRPAQFNSASIASTQEPHSEQRG